MNNILTDKEFVIDDFNPQYIAKKISKNYKQKRLQLNITQEVLSKKSGVSLGSIKRFEMKSEISLKHLLMLALILDSCNEFLTLFTSKTYKSIDEIKLSYEKKNRVRARK